VEEHPEIVAPAGQNDPLIRALLHEDDAVFVDGAVPRLEQLRRENEADDHDDDRRADRAPEDASPYARDAIPENPQDEKRNDEVDCANRDRAPKGAERGQQDEGEEERGG